MEQIWVSKFWYFCFDMVRLQNEWNRAATPNSCIGLWIHAIWIVEIRLSLLKIKKILPFKYLGYVCDSDKEGGYNSIIQFNLFISMNKKNSKNFLSYANFLVNSFLPLVYPTLYLLKLFSILTPSLGLYIAFSYTYFISSCSSPYMLSIKHMFISP